MNDQKDYLYFIDEWMDRPENCGRSFTYGAAMYDWIAEGRGSFDDLGIYDRIVESVADELEANREKVSYLSDEALAEIVDISELDELGREIGQEISESEKEELFDTELDNMEFKNMDELIKTIKKLKEEKTYYLEDFAEDLAEEYAEDRDLFDNDDEDDS